MKKKIRILYIMDYFFSQLGGTEGQLYNLIKNIDKDIFEPELCLFRQTKTSLEASAFPCHVFYLHIKSLYSFFTYFKLLKLRRYVKAKGINIVQILFNDAALVVPLATMGLDVKTISTRRDMGFWYTPFKLLILRVNTLITDKYYANSCAVKENIKRKEHVPENKIAVIRNAHNLKRFLVKPKYNFFQEQRIPEGSNIIGIVANLRPIKRVDDLIVAFADIIKHYPNSYLLVVGHPGKLKNEYLKLTKSLEIESYIRFLGEIQDVIPIIKYWTVGVNCSDSEGLSNVLIEYMGCQVPIVATDTGGNRELIGEEKRGLLVPVGNSKALATAILRILDNSNLRRNIIKNSSEFIKEMFDESSIIEQYQKSYIELKSNEVKIGD